MKVSNLVKITADSIKVNGPRVDGSYGVTFSVGEYQQKEIAQLIMIPQQTMIQLDINYDK